jgi:hypothetical protein
MHELEEKMYQEEFRAYDEFHDGFVSKKTFIDALSSHSQYHLGPYELQQVWSLASYNRKEYLDQSEFIAAMHIIQNVNRGQPIPTKLPLDLIPMSHLSTTWADQNPFRLLSSKPAPDAVKIIPLNPEMAEQVSNELWILILRNLPMASLRKASRVSRKFHDLGILLLYRNVDLSLHDHEPYQFVHGNYSPSETYRTHGPSDEELRRTLKRQCRFILQLFHKPEYGPHVRTLKWTLGLETGHSPHRKLLPSWIEGSRFRWEPERVYKVFHLLSYVHSIDIGGTSTRYHHLPDLGPLFPRARRIRLRGSINYELAWDILHDAHKAPITSLSLHDVHLADYPPSAADTPSRHTNMGRLFKIPSLRQRCQYIESLSLCKLGQQHAIQKDSGVLLRDEEVYQEWAKFITAVEPTNLILAHSGLPDAPWNDHPPLPTCHVSVGGPQGPPPWPRLSPMSELFRDIVLPVLVKPWPCISNLELRGVQKAVLQALTSSSRSFGLQVDEELSSCWHVPGQYGQH